MTVSGSKMFVSSRYVGRDIFGRVYLDTCASDEEHLTKPAEGKERRDCRKYLDDLMPEDLIGKMVSGDIRILLSENTVK